MHTAILEIRHPNGENELREMLQGTLSIGSEIGEILLPDPKVSGSHARLRLQGMALTYTDVGSSTGSFVEELRLTAPRTLAPGMRVRLGDSEILLRGFGLKRTSRTEVTVKIHRSMFGLPASADGSPLARTGRSRGVPSDSSTTVSATKPMPTLLARIALDGQLVPMASVPVSPDSLSSPLNARPAKEATSSSTGKPNPETNASSPSTAAPIAATPDLGSLTALPTTHDPSRDGTSTPAIVVDPANGPSSASSTDSASHGTDGDFAGDSESIDPLGESTPLPRAGRQLARWSLLIGAAAAAAAFFVWRGGYTLPGLPTNATARTHTHDSPLDDARDDASLANIEPSANPHDRAHDRGEPKPRRERTRKKRSTNRP